MAQGSKAAMAAAPTAPSNGLVAATSPPGAAAVNRKKQKRRAKQAAKAAELAQKQGAPTENGHLPPGSTALPQQGSAPHTAHDINSNGALDPEDADLHDHGAYDDQYFSDDDGQGYDHQYPPAETNGHYPAGKKSKKKKKKSKGSIHPPSEPQALAPPPPPPPSSNTLRTMQRSKDKIWNTSTQEERENIKEFWLSLGEDERKSLVKIEKEAVLRKMKEQQKHSCSCTVCGRKRTAIEEELEVLYDAYYEELEQYANHQQPENGAPIPLPPSRAIRGGALYPPTPHSPIHTRHRLEDTADEDDDDEEEEEGDSEEYSDEEDEEDEYSDEDVEEIPRGPAADFFNFGNSLTVKGGILTVADDLLKNDGKKFIEMMEQLAERRMARENEAQYRMNAAHPNSHHNHGPPPEEDEYEDEEEEYDSAEEEDYEEEDEMDALTEEQRMEEGRRMFQIFAARMFEQRVLTAYREKVARERQQKLLEELNDEDERDKARQEKKARDAAKKKERKRQQQQAKAEEKAKKEAEKAEQERLAKEAEEKRQEEQRRKKEEQRKKREAERKAQEEERQRKEAERQKRLKEERERQQEAERKAREQKLQEKHAREEAKRKEREEREAKEKEAREKKAHEEKAKKEREAKLRADQEAKDRARREEQHAHASPGQSHGHPKRAAQPPVALPPGLLSKQSSTGFPSPLVQVATPALPKAPTPNRPRQSSQQGSHGSSPKTPHVAPGTSKSMSPAASLPSAQSINAPKTILQKPHTQPIQPQPSPLHHPQPTSPMPPMGPPPGMHPAPGFGVPPGMNGFPPGQMPPLPGMGPRPPMGHNMPIFPHNPLNSQFRPFGPPGSLPPPPPPGMTGPPMMQHGRGMPLESPPGFPAAIPGMTPVSQAPGFGLESLPTHSRQQSASFDKPAFDPAIGTPQANPIQRPAPIGRPSSVKLGDGKDDKDLEDLSRHLGSSALLDDADDLPNFDADRRSSGPLGIPTRGTRMPFGNGAIFPPDPNAPRMDSFGLSSSGPGSAWSTPSLGAAFGPMSAGGWGTSPTSGLPGGLFNNAFGAVMSQNRPNVPRPQTIRLLACQACKNLYNMKGAGSDGFHDVSEVLQQVNRNLKVGEPQVPQNELLDIFETEGDEHNGGGLFVVQDRGQGKAVKFEEGSRKVRGPNGLGEIGSPVPGHSIPVGFGAPRASFPGLGV